MCAAPPIRLTAAAPSGHETAMAGGFVWLPVRPCYEQGAIEMLDQRYLS
jgi:hypothetical protein